MHTRSGWPAASVTNGSLRSRSRAALRSLAAAAGQAEIADRRAAEAERQQPAHVQFDHVADVGDSGGLAVDHVAGQQQEVRILALEHQTHVDAERALGAI